MCLIIARTFFSFGTFLGFVFRDVIPVPFQLAGSEVPYAVLGPCHFLIQGVALGSASVPLAPLTTLLCSASGPGWIHVVILCHWPMLMNMTALPRTGPWVDPCSDPVPLAGVVEVC